MAGKNHCNILDAEEDFGFGETIPSSSGAFDAEPFNFHSPVNIVGFGSKAKPFDLKLGNAVGAGEVNEPKDVAKLRRLLRATGDIVPGGRTKSDPVGDVSLGIPKLQRRIGARRDGFVRPGGETVAKSMQTLFGLGAGNPQAKNPAPGAALPTPDAFSRASRASLATVPSITRPIVKPTITPKPAGPNGIVIGGSTLEQTEGLMQRIKILAPLGYRYMPKMGSLAAHWIGPDLLPISETQVQTVMRTALAKPAAATRPPSAPPNAGRKAAPARQGGGSTVKPTIPGKETATIGELRNTANGTVLAPLRPRSWKLPGGSSRNRLSAGLTERIVRNIFSEFDKGMSGVGRVVRAAGQGFGDAFDGRMGIGPETWEALVRVGLFRSNNNSILSGFQAFNEVLFGKGAIAGDFVLRAVQGIENIGVGAIVQFAREAGASETGARKLKRDLGALAMIAGIVTGRNAGAFGGGGRRGRRFSRRRTVPRNFDTLPKLSKSEIEEILGGDWIVRIARNHALPGQRASKAGRILPNRHHWLISPETGGWKGHFVKHGLKLNVFTPKQYYQQARRNIRWGNRWTIRHDPKLDEILKLDLKRVPRHIRGQRKHFYITDLGDRTYMLTSTTLDGKFIFTHHRISKEDYLKFREKVEGR